MPLVTVWEGLWSWGGWGRAAHRQSLLSRQRLHLWVIKSGRILLMDWFCVESWFVAWGQGNLSFSRLGKLWQLRLFGNSSRKFPHEIWKIAHLFCRAMLQFSSVQFSHSVMSDCLQPYESQQARPPCPSTTPRVCPNSCALSRWCHPTISSSVIPLSSCPKSLAASGSFPMSQLFASGGQSIGVSASASVLPMNTQDWPPLGWTG